jgi:prefoldin subunit 5
MLSKIEAQLSHLEKTHFSTINDLTAEVKAVKQTLENAKSKFIGFE